MVFNKKKTVTALLGISLLTGVLPSFGQAAAEASVSFQVFYDQLSPFGNWVSYRDYGYVWVPAANSGFRPYGTRGHWIYTDEGWTWISDYSWGWATFHYGNWFYDNTYGWIWVPGYEWAPAWVTWGEYGGDYCWAPVGPRVDIGVSFGTYRPAYNYWNFCPRGHMADLNVSHYFVNNIRNTTAINRITVINNVNRAGGRSAYLRGPAPANVERFTHTLIRPVAIQASSRPGTARVQHGQLSIYRPVVRNYNAGVRPARVQDLHALRPANRTQSQASVANNTRTPLQQRPSTTHLPAGHRYPANPSAMQQHPAGHPMTQPHALRPPTVQRQMPVRYQAPPHQAVQPSGSPLVRNQPPPSQMPHENPHEHH